jgi:hypothetical protein
MRGLYRAAPVACSTNRELAGRSRTVRQSIPRAAPALYRTGIVLRWPCILQTSARETRMNDQRGITICFNDGSKVSMDFPKQTDNEHAAALKLDDVLKKRYMLFEADSTLLMIPFENVKYVQVYPAPADIPGQTYIKGASIKD